MTGNNVHNLNAHRPGKSGSGLQPVSPSVATAILSSCLSLVRPVGMAEAETDEWLTVAVDAVCHLPESILDQAALVARRTCTHHSQIVPAIIKEADEIMERWRRVDRHPVVNMIPPAQRLPPPRLTQDDCENLSPLLRRIGLSAGYLIENEDGSVSPAPDAA